MLPRRLQPLNSTCALLALCLLLNACSDKRAGRVAVITEQQVASVLDKIDRAARNKDVDAIFEHLSEDAKIEMNIQGGHMTLTRDQYRDYARQSYTYVSGYEYERKNTVIKVAPDGQSAVASGQVFEAVTMGGRTIRSTTLETAIFKVLDGRVVITSIVGDVILN